MRPSRHFARRDWVQERVDVPGGQVWCGRLGAGAGAPVLLLHGGPGAASDYLAGLAEALAEDRPVVLFDQLGCGRSERPSGRELWTLDRAVEEVAAVRAALGLTRCVVLGHSWGSWLAQECLARGAAGVEALVLASTSASLPDYVATLEHWIAAMPEPHRSRLRDPAAAGGYQAPVYLDAVDAFYRRHLCRSSPWPDVLAESVEDEAANEAYRVMAGPNDLVVDGRLRSWDRTAELAGVRCPTLVTCGRWDAMHPDCARRVADGIPGARLAVFAHSGHLPHLEEPVRYGAVVRAFLAGAPTSADDIEMPPATGRGHVDGARDAGDHRRDDRRPRPTESSSDVLAEPPSHSRPLRPRTGMKVARVSTRVVNVPYMEPETWYFGRSWGLTSVLVTVETDDGLIGVGECPGVPNVAAAENAVETMGRMLVGEDPQDILAFRRRTRMHGWHHFPYLGNCASAALEMAMWDIVGKAAGKPLHELWGGLEQATVPYYFYIFVPERDEATARAQAAEAVADGFRTLYFKIGFDLEGDLALVRAVRDEVGPGVALRVDANEGWSPFEAVDGLRAFEEVGLEFFEQPIDMHNLEGLHYLRRHTQTRIGANQSAWQPHQVRDVLASGAADVIVTDPHQLGGMSVFRDVAGMCEVWGVPLVKHSFGDLGLTTAATLHTLGGLPKPWLAHQTHLTLLEHDLLTQPFVFREGSLRVPDAPGLGVELDLDAVAHYADLWTSVGELASYGEFDKPSPFGDTAARPDQRPTPVIAAREPNAD